MIRTQLVPLSSGKGVRGVAAETMRTHVVIPRALVAAVDRLVGKRARSRFVVEAVAEKLARERRATIFKDAAGSLADVDVPGWETGEATSAWVRRSRARDDERLDRRWTETG
jgi:hypothetical protein